MWIELTIGKIYSVIREYFDYYNFDYYEILDDNGEICHVIVERFIDLKTHRKQKLKKINENSLHQKRRTSFFWTNNFGYEECYPKSLFLTEKEERKLKLKKLNESRW